jgi:peptidoglycan-associated lipoprotein
MKQMLIKAVPFAVLAALAGCATQSTEEASGQSQSQASPATSSGTRGQQGSQASTTRGAQGGSAASAKMSKNSVYYDFDKYDIRPESRAVIEAHARYLRENPNAKVRIEGNADERGTTEYNLALGQQRSEGVLKMMKLLGIPDSRIEAVSFGKEKPKATGHDEASWQENRRSDIVYR